MNQTIKVPNSADYWGGDPSDDDIEQLYALILDIAPNAEIELVEELHSWNNRNDEESARILERAWLRFCGQ